MKRHKPDFAFNQGNGMIESPNGEWVKFEDVQPLIDFIKGLRKESVVGADGTRIKCTCNREGCIEFWCSAGDQIYVNSYANKLTLEEALEKAGVS